MAETQAYKAAQIIEERRLGKNATGIPTISDRICADEIDDMYEAEFRRRLAVVVDDARREAEARVQEAKVEVLESASKAFSRECLGFQAGWGSNEIDLAKLDVLGKTQTWLEERAFKYRDPLPRYINLKDTYRTLSDGAEIKYRGEVFTHRIGFGDFVSIKGDNITARLHDEDVTLINHNL